VDATLTLDPVRMKEDERRNRNRERRKGEKPIFDGVNFESAGKGSTLRYPGTGQR